MSQNEANRQEACFACALKDKCQQTTETCFTKHQQWKALTLGYILPFVVLAGGIVAMSALQWSEMFIGCIALGFVAVYYFVLWLCKPKI